MKEHNGRVAVEQVTARPTIPGRGDGMVATMALAQSLTLDRKQAVNLPAALNAHAELSGWPYRCDPSKEFDGSELKSLSALWHAKANGDLPGRAAFDLRTLQPFVRNIFMLERLGQKGVWRYRFRLFGSGLTQLFGEHTGRWLDETVSPALLQNWLACFDTTIRYGAPLRFINYYRTQTNDFLKGEFFAAPLAEETPGQPLLLAATYVGHKDAAHSPLD